MAPRGDARLATRLLVVLGHDKLYAEPMASSPGLVQSGSNSDAARTNRSSLYAFCKSPFKPKIRYEIRHSWPRWYVLSLSTFRKRYQRKDFSGCWQICHLFEVGEECMQITSDSSAQISCAHLRIVTTVTSHILPQISDEHTFSTVSLGSQKPCKSLHDKEKGRSTVYNHPLFRYLCTFRSVSHGDSKHMLVLLEIRNHRINLC